VDKQEIRARLFSARKIGKELCAWDTADIVAQEAKYLMEEFPDEYPDEDAAYRTAWESDICQFEWEYLAEYVTELMKERGMDEEPIYCEVANFGWRGINGQQVFYAENGPEFLKAILPDTNNTFHIYEYSDGLAINNFHHDSPIGREWYYATPLQSKATIEIDVETAKMVVSWLERGYETEKPLEDKEIDEVLFEAFAEFDLGWRFELRIINTEDGPWMQERWLENGEAALEEYCSGDCLIGEYFEIETDEGVVLGVDIVATKEESEIEKG